MLDFRAREAAGWNSTLFSGKGLVVKVTGPGLTLRVGCCLALSPGLSETQIGV